MKDTNITYATKLKHT